MQSATQIEGKSCWVVDALATTFESKSGILVSASQEISCPTYLKNIIAMLSAAALDWVWQSSNDWEKSWTTQLMSVPRRARARAFPLRFPGAEQASAYLRRYHR